MSCSFMLILTSLRNLSTFNKKWLLFAIKIIKFYIHTHTHTHILVISRDRFTTVAEEAQITRREQMSTVRICSTQKGSSWWVWTQDHLGVKPNKTNKTKNNNKKGQSLLHLVQFKHVESFLITYRQEAFKCSYSNRK